MGETTRRIEPEGVSESAWQPFGWLPVLDTDPEDGQNRLAFEWADPHVNIIGHRRDEVPNADGVLRCEVLYRHRTHTQVIMPLDVDAVIAVAPAASDPRTAGGAGEIRAFALPVQQAIVLARGTWHWGPFPVEAESVRLFNVQGLRYAEDNDSADLAAAGTSVEVAVH
ncbi:MAG TPA: ureidoglycolate lyase [Acidimicrobiales bacterium]|nr:ureidoglycolate lyase [Acidimicrobiales bacterium]